MPNSIHAPAPHLEGYSPRLSAALDEELCKPEYERIDALTFIHEGLKAILQRNPELFDDHYYGDATAKHCIQYPDTPLPFHVPEDEGGISNRLRAAIAAELENPKYNGRTDFDAQHDAMLALYCEKPDSFDPDKPEDMLMIAFFDFDAEERAAARR